MFGGTLGCAAGAIEAMWKSEKDARLRKARVEIEILSRSQAVAQETLRKFMERHPLPLILHTRY